MPHKTKQATPAAAILNCDINEHGNRLYQCARHGEVHMLAKEDPIWRPISRITDNEKTITLSRMQAEATEDDWNMQMITQRQINGYLNS